MTTSSRRRGLTLGSVGLVLVTAACSSASTSTTPSTGTSSAGSMTSRPSAMTSRPSTMPTPTMSAGVLTVTGKNAELTLASGTASALKSAGVQVAPVAPATAKSAGAVSFPVTGGR